MKVLHVTSARTRRGGENQLFYLANGLGQRGVENLIVIPADAEYAQPRGSQRIRFAGEADLLAMRHLGSVIREFDPDIVHAHTAHAHAWSAGALMGKKVPLVVSRRVAFHPSGNPLSRWKMKQTTRYICISRTVAGVLIDSGVPRETISIVHSGVPVTPWSAAQGLRSRFGIPDDALLIVSLAAFTPNKNQATLVCALSLLEEDHSVFCILAGEGRTRVKTERLTSDLHLGGRIRFPGFVTNPHELLCSADVFVLTSFSEGLSTSTIEAMAAGLPVIASRCGGVEEVVEDGVSGLLVTPGEPEELAGAIRTLDGNRKAMSEMGERGRVLASHFSVERMVRETLSIYQDLT